MACADLDDLFPASISILAWHHSAPKNVVLKIAETEHFPLLTNIQHVVRTV